jgi:hypothetical protein
MLGQDSYVSKGGPLGGDGLSEKPNHIGQTFKEKVNHTKGNLK